MRDWELDKSKGVSYDLRNFFCSSPLIPFLSNMIWKSAVNWLSIAGKKMGIGTVIYTYLSFEKVLIPNIPIIWF